MSDDLTPKSIIFSTMKPEFNKEIVVDPTSFKGKVEKLRAKWRAADDSDEKRDMCSLVTGDVSTLSNCGLAILADNPNAYKNEGWEEGKYWRKHLNLACLSGSIATGEFIIQNKHNELTPEDYGNLLGYISASFNEEWAVAFAKQMQKKSMLVPPSSVYYFCDDFDLIQKIKRVFSEQHTSHPTLL